LTSADIVTVTASRNSRILADRASLYVVVEGTAETAPDAVARVETKLKAVSAALKGFGSRLEVDPPIAYAVGATPAPNGYLGAATPASNLARGGVAVSAPTLTARTDRNGWVRTVRLAETRRGRRMGRTGAGGLVEAQTSDGLMRLDLWLDPSSTIGAHEPDSADAAHAALDAARRRPSVRAGGIRLRALVTDGSGKPIPGARACVVGHRFAVGDQNGTVVLDSLPGGSQTLEVRALGFVPLTREVHLSERNSVTDTIALTSVKSLLDTIRVSAGRVYAVDATGFEFRRKTGIGSYITAEEVERFHPYSLASLLQARSGVSIQDTPMGDQLIGMAAAWGGTCTPTVWVDGDLVVHPAGPSAGALLVSPSAQAAAAAGRAQSTTQATAKGGTVVAGLSPTQAAGLAELSWLVMPSDIEGVEIYRRPMEIPAQFVVGGYAGCGAIVIWTRWRTALPQTTPPPSGAPHDRN
jgi:hypothetical protein